MIRNQEENLGALLGIEIQTVHGAVGNLQAAFDVIASRDALSGVVQQKRQVEQFGIFQFAEQFPVSLIPLGLRLLQAMQALDCKERMFVDGEPVVKIAHDERVDELQLRQQQGQYA